MADTTGAFRFAIATLGVPVPLRAAVDELEGQRILADKLGLAGTLPALDGLRAAPWPDGARLLLDVAPLPMIEGRAIYATAKNWVRDLKASESSARAAGMEPRCWLAPALREGLMERMLAGEVMLLAGPLTADELTASTRVLLKHSDHHVQSHTFAPPRWP